MAVRRWLRPRPIAASYCLASYSRLGRHTRAHIENHSDVNMNSGEIVVSTFRFLFYIFAILSFSIGWHYYMMWCAMAMEKDVILLYIWRWSLRKWHTEERVADNGKWVGLAGERAKGRIIFEWILDDFCIFFVFVGKISAMVLLKRRFRRWEKWHEWRTMARAGIEF